MASNPDVPRVSIATASGTTKFKLHPAEAFGGPAGLFRVQRDRAFVGPGHKQLQFFTLDAALTFMARDCGLSGAAPECPALRYRQRVRVRVWDEEADRVIPEKCFTSSPPFQGVDGRWRIMVLTMRQGVMEFLCDDVEGL